MSEINTNTSLQFFEYLRNHVVKYRYRDIEVKEGDDGVVSYSFNGTVTLKQGTIVTLTLKSSYDVSVGGKSSDKSSNNNTNPLANMKAWFTKGAKSYYGSESGLRSL